MVRSKRFGEASGLCQPRESLLLHTPTPWAGHPAVLEFQIDSSPAGVQIPDPVNLAVVEAFGGLAA